MSTDTGARYLNGFTFSPRRKNESAELVLTYRCNLDCYGCTRGCFLQEPHTPDLTLEDAHEFFRQCRELNWKPNIVITGGEPTLHPQFDEFCRIAVEFNRDVRVFSNQNGARASQKIREAQSNHGVSVVGETAKPSGAMRKYTGISGWTDDAFVSPSDFGEPLRVPCYQHCSVLCGISVDAVGYSPCAPGGAIDALLGCGVRTKRLADLFEIPTMAVKTALLCQHCGVQRAKRENVAKCEVIHGTPMSPVWVKAFEGRK